MAVPRLTSLRRRPVVWWVATLLLAAVTAQVVSGAVARAERGAARYGRVRAVLVATTDLAPGSVLDAGDAEVRFLPAGLVPDAAVAGEAIGRRVRAPVFAGEVVHRDRLAPAGLSAVAALLPAGTRGVAVASSSETVPLQPGDVVDVLATVVAGPTDGEAFEAPTVTVAADVVVVAVEEGAVTVAVPVEETPQVAYAAASGIVTLALVGG